MIPVVVITQPRFRGRLEQFRVRWSRLGLQDYEVYEAEDLGDPIRGCFSSHLDVLRSHEGPLAVFEDDAIFAPSFTLDISPPEPADIIWLGGQHLRQPTGLATGWVRPASMARSHAYIVADAHKVAGQLSLEPRRHFDIALSNVQLPQLALSPFTVGQSAGVSSICGRNFTAHRFWND